MNEKKAEAIIIWTDSAFAGCEKSRKTTSAGVVMWSTHLIKSLSTNQAVIAFSSGRSEYYAADKAGSAGLGTEALAEEIA